MNPREWATYKEVWKLTPGEREKLDRFFLKYARASDLYAHISDEHEYKDLLENSGIYYTVTYIDCGLSSLEALGDNLVLVSFRYLHKSNLAYALVWHPERLSHEDIKKQATELEF